MAQRQPRNAADVRRVIEERVSALGEDSGLKETVTVEWRGHQRAIPVISMPIDLLSYNPETHRVRAQRSLEPERDRALTEAPFGVEAQTYLHHLLMGDPSDPARTDPTFEALKEDLEQHGQSEPGIVTRAGVLVNGNTRRAALKVLNQTNMRVGVLPGDAGLDDMQSIELALQLRRDHKREYSFMNFLIALEEMATNGASPADIQTAFRIKAKTYEQNRWILAFVLEAIGRSRVTGRDGGVLALRLVDFESHRGKLEELFRAYRALRGSSPDEADALREQRLLAIALGKSKTDVRLIDSDFSDKYMKTHAPTSSPNQNPHVAIPGTNIVVPGSSSRVEALKAQTTAALQAKAIEISPDLVSKPEATAASLALKKLDESLEEALTQAGKQGRLVKRRLAAADRLADANEDLELSLEAVAEARSTGTFDPEDIDEAMVAIKNTLLRLAQIALRDTDVGADGIAWLRAVATMPDPQS